jgi:hypothetical protein
MTLSEDVPGITHLDRDIRFVEAYDASGIGDASNATLFLGLYGILLSPADQADVIRAIQNANPLAIFIAGEGAERLFDDLLQALSVETAPRPMMTKYSVENAKEAIDLFLNSTWPCEESHDDWKSYVVVSYGTSVAPLRAAVDRAVSR